MRFENSNEIDENKEAEQKRQLEEQERTEEDREIEYQKHGEEIDEYNWDEDDAEYPFDSAETQKDVEANTEESIEGESDDDQELTEEEKYQRHGEELEDYDWEADDREHADEAKQVEEREKVEEAKEEKAEEVTKVETELQTTEELDKQREMSENQEKEVLNVKETSDTLPENNKEIEEKIDSNEKLNNKLEQIKDDAYATRDSEGYISSEAKEKLVEDMKRAYDSTPKEERGNTLVPEKSEYLKNPPIAENKETGNRYSDVNYNWPKNGGFEGKPEEITPQVGDKFDRVGNETGRYVAPYENDAAQSVEKRGLPYHFVENDIKNEPSYHLYEVNRNFGELQDAINEYNNPYLTPEENEFMRNEFQKEYNKSNWVSDEYTHEPGKTYAGEIAKAFDAGGGSQWELPMSVESLKELDMIKEV